MPPEDKDLEPVTDLKIVQRYLKYGSEFKEDATCFLEDDGPRFEAFISSVNTAELKMELEIPEEHFAKLEEKALFLLSQAQTGIRVGYSVNEASIFVHGKIMSHFLRSFIVEVTMPMLKLQRRAALRLKLTGSIKASLKIDGNTYPAFDISAGGISLVVNFAEQANFKKQQLLQAIVLTFQGNEFNVNLETINITAHGKEGTSHRVGFRFRNLPAAAEQMIAREAYLWTHQIWSRWL
jgi:c-di-GMP-binding flagellar brake protein YcgR